MALQQLAQAYTPLALMGKFHYIDGKFVTPDAPSFVDTHNPATGDVICRLPNASETEIFRAFDASDRVRVSFGNSSIETRITILEKLASLIKENSKRLAIIETFDCGKALREAEADMNDSVGCINHFIHLLKTTSFEEDKGTNGDFLLKIRWESVGVFALITPWNFPFLMALQKVVTAIAAGCPSVLKPSEYASFSCIELASLLDKIPELPHGAFNLLIGTGSGVGNMMISHKTVRKVSFTGSVPTGKVIMKACAERMCPVHMELGGKSAMIVFEDANMTALIDWIQLGIYWGAGQVCTATSRLIIHESIYQTVLQKLKSAAEQIQVGPGLEPTTTMGPLISPQQFEKVKSYIRHGIEVEGLNLLYGGLEKPNGIPLGYENGYFVRPTAFFDVHENSKLWKEEIFGPVLCIRSFKTEDEAIRLANDSEYGLGGAVMTSDTNRATRVANQLEAGSIWVNNSQPVIMDCGMPFGGFKQSGFGKEMGKEGFFEYLQPKAIVYTKENDFHFDAYPKAKI